MKRAIERISENCISLLAWGIRFVGINQVSYVSVEGREYVLKRRRWFSRPLIWLGNIVFRFRRPGVRVLPTSEWMVWEQKIESAISSPAENVLSARLCTGTDFVSEKIPGIILRDLLRAASDDDQRKGALIAMAAKALFELHKRQIEITDEAGGSSEILISHGDATVQNVFVDEIVGKAIWFDFDLRHDLSFPATERHADDLRAFVYSLAYSSDSTDVQDLIAQIRVAYPNPTIWTVLANQVADSNFRYDLFHLAQIRRTGTKSGATGHANSRNSKASIKSIGKVLSQVID